MKQFLLNGKGGTMEDETFTGDAAVGDDQELIRPTRLAKQRRADPDVALSASGARAVDVKMDVDIAGASIQRLTE